jgi:hypothetical protein
MNRRQFFGAAALPLIGSGVVASVSAPVPQFKKFYCVTLWQRVWGEPLPRTDKYPTQLLIGCYDPAAEWSLETEPRIIDGKPVMMERLMMVLGKKRVPMQIQTKDQWLFNPDCCKSTNSPDMFVAIGNIRDNSTIWNGIKQSQRWMHPININCQDIEVIVNKPEYAVICWTNSNG